MNKKLKNLLEKQNYAVIGKHSAIQICRWCKKSLLDDGGCYKSRFYGIESWRCCQMSPAVMNCQNKCLHCWRAIEFNEGIKIKNEEGAEKIINECIKAQKKMLSGFKGNERVNMKKFIEAQNPKHFAISLSGEPTIYSKIGELIELLRKKGKTTFLVTNGLNPKKLLELEKNKQLPTQLYISLNTSNKKKYESWHNSCYKDAWKRFNKSLDIMRKLKNKTRTVLRMTLVKDLNMSDEDVRGFSLLIKKASPMFVEVKGFMSVGFARQRLGYEKMPWHNDIKDFSKKLLKELKNLGLKYKFLDEKIESRIVLLGVSKKDMKIKKEKI